MHGSPAEAGQGGSRGRTHRRWHRLSRKGHLRNTRARPRPLGEASTLSMRAADTGHPALCSDRTDSSHTRSSLSHAFC